MKKKKRIKSGVDILNVSGADKTSLIIQKIRDIDDRVAILATGGRTELNILKCIEFGANAISYTPPSTGELFKDIMAKYRAQDNA